MISVMFTKKNNIPNGVLKNVKSSGIKAETLIATNIKIYKSINDLGECKIKPQKR